MSILTQEDIILPRTKVGHVDPHIGERFDISKSLC